MSNSVRFKAKNGLDNNSNTIINVADPVNAQDVATKNFVTTSISSSSGGGFAGTIGISSATTLDATYANKFIEVNGASPLTINLPLATVYTKDGTQLTFLVAYGSAAITLSTVSVGSAYIFNGTQGTSQTLVLNAGDSVILTTTASNINYIVTGGSAGLPYTSTMTGANWTTPTSTDNSTRLATTAFVKTALSSIAGLAWTPETTSFTAASNNGYQISSSSSVTVTLPASPANNDKVILLDYTQNSNTYNIIVAGNGHNIQGSSSNLTVDVNGIGLTLTYISSSVGWIISDTGNVVAGGVGPTQWVAKTSSFTASSNSSYAVTASSALTVTLPASPSNNDVIRILDAGGNSNTYHFTISGNGNNVGGASTLVIDVNTASVELTYFTGSGWVITDSGNIINGVGAASLLSPAFTGTPTAPTAAMFDETTKIATTAYVQNAIGSFSAQNFVTVGGTLTSANVGQINVLSAAANMYLPLASTCPAGSVISFLSLSSGSAVYASGSNVLSPNTTTFTSITMNSGDTLQIESNGISTWYIVGGSLSLQYASSLASSSGAATLTSPALTGTPTAPTPAQFDNTTKIATTAFVQTASGNYQTVFAVSGTTTLTAAQLGDAIEISGSSTYTVTLPTPVGYTGKAFSIWSIASVGITFSTPSGTIIPTGVAGASTYVLPAYSSAEFIADGANWVVAFSSINQPSLLPLTSSVAANALTVGLNSTTLTFRNATVGSLPVTLTNTSALSLTVPSTATLGTTSGVAARLVVLALNNAGTIALGIINIAGGTTLDETLLVSTTAISTAATSNNVIYSASALTNVAYKVVGFIDITEATAGTWATAATNIQGSTYFAPFASPTFYGIPTAPTAAVTTNSTQLATTAYVQSVADQIQPITSSVAANALTVGLNPTNLTFRNTTVGSAPVRVSNSSALSLVVPSTATLGTVSGQAARLVILALNNAGTMALGIVNIAGGTVLDESGLVTTVAISTGATSNSVIYSTALLTSVAYRVVGYIDITEATAGTWATAATNIQGNGGQILAAMSSVGYGQTWQLVTRTSGTTYYNTTGKPIVALIALGITTVGTCIPVVNSYTFPTLTASTGNSSERSIIIPPGASYSWTGTASTVWSELR